MMKIKLREVENNLTFADVRAGEVFVTCNEEIMMKVFFRTGVSDSFNAVRLDCGQMCGMLPTDAISRIVKNAVWKK